MPAVPQDRRPKAEKASDPPTFTVDGETYSLPPRKAINAGMLRRHRGKSGDDYVFSILEDASDPETIAAMDTLSLDEMNDVIEAWSDAVFGTDPGNS
jgi:hypothetical protein